MGFFFLVLMVTAITLFAVFSRTNAVNKPNRSSKNWIKAGGILGIAIFLARFVRLPLATIITLLPFILPHLRRAEQAQGSAGNNTMTREEAALILGVAANAAEEEIKTAHRILITKNHPDKGGSDYLAAKINQARDVLLSR